MLHTYSIGAPILKPEMRADTNSKTIIVLLRGIELHWLDHNDMKYICMKKIVCHCDSILAELSGTTGNNGP